MFGSLARFSNYIIENKIDDFTQYQIDRARQVNLPVLQYFRDYTDEELFEFSKRSIIEFLKSIAVGRGIEEVKLANEKWKRGESELFSKTEIVLKDVVLANKIRKEGLIYFLKFYVDNIRDYEVLILEIERFYEIVLENSFAAFVEVQQELVLKEKEIISAIVNNSTDGIYAFDARQKIKVWNPTMVARTGVSSEQIMDKDVFEFFPEYLQVFEKKVPERVINGETVTIKNFKTLDGKTHYDIYMAPLKDIKGDVFGGISIMRDVTEDKKREEQLEIKVRERTRKLLLQSQVLECMEEGVSVADQDGIIIFTNKAEDAMFGYETGQMTGMHVSCQNAYPPEQNETIVQSVIETLNDKGAWSGEWHNKRKDGTTFYTYSHITALNLDGIKYFVCVQRDISEEKRYKEAIEEKNKELQRINIDLDNFIYTASHDLKAPVSNIEGLIDALKEAIDEEESQDIEQLLNMISVSVNRFKETILDLTEISKIQKEEESKVEPVDCLLIINDVKLSMQDIINSTSATIEIEADHEVDLKFSKKNFRSIVYNLLSNAIKYRHPKRNPIVQIHLKDLPEWTLLSIKDNGLGVSEDQKNKMFSMFKRFHDHVEGTGIGLYIIKRIIDNAQGKIEVTTAKDIGTKFDIYFKKEHS